ncbi:DUF418 domain-containing protein [Paenibacillus sp. SC116]|uniref:DUF418 domain-containing protein n=1 Tax=Paenibacillus sp. SC116 TaxID=2968986 RepID=UPI00215AEF85|nr:DUF418 domain-containing protein [Paenibacillus sp. SC116]MCR8844579.1 DUF418 domain-containing protein [Paenibacillus sp. SC116]
MSVQIQQSQRIDTMDIIRGFAIIGIFIVNFPEMVGSGVLFYDTAFGSDAIVRWLYDLFIQTKFYTIFAFLFGAGFHLFMKSAEKRGLSAKKLMSRRLFLLFVVGVAHVVLFWIGDILNTYAMAGLLLLLFYNRSSKTLIVWSLVMLSMFNGLLVLTAFMPSDPSIDVSILLPHVPNMSERIDFFLTLGLPNSLLMLLDIVSCALIGIFAARNGWLQPSVEQRKNIQRVQWSALILTGLLFIPMVQAFIANPTAYQPSDVTLYTQLTGKALAVVYVCAMLRLVARYGAKPFQGLSALGRMAFTNYLLQTIITMGVLHFIWKDAGEAPLWMGAIFALVVVSLQMIVSRWWLRRYNMGPLEWLWRAGTYGRFSPLRRVSHFGKETGQSSTESSSS